MELKELERAKRVGGAHLGRLADSYLYNRRLQLPLPHSSQTSRRQDVRILQKVSRDVVMKELIFCWPCFKISMSSV